MKIHKSILPSGLELRHTPNGDFLIVNSKLLTEAVEYILESKKAYLELNHALGFKENDLDFLNGYELLIGGLDIADGKIDLTRVNNMCNLEYLRIVDELSQPIDFSIFKKLFFCSIKWNKQYSKAVFPENIKHFYINSYNIKYPLNASSLQNLRTVSELTLTKALIADLELLDDFNGLTKLDLIYCRLLTDVNSLQKHADILTQLNFNNCKSINNYQVLGSLTRLKWLNILNCKPIKSIRFIENMLNLNHFVFYGTVVEDGQLSPLKKVKQVGFDNKPHYSLKEKDFQ